MPAPAAMAPRVHRMAAPSMPGEPAATPTAVVHLLTWRGRAGTSATSASSTSSACGVGNPIPMSATSTAPLQAAPSPCSSPGLSAAKVTVRSRLHGVARRVAAVGVDPRGDVDGQDRRARRHAPARRRSRGTRCRTRRR